MALAHVPRRARALVRVAVAQMTSTSDRERNFGVCASLAAEAARRGSKVVFFPEGFHFLGAAPGDSLAIAEPLNGPTIDRYCDLARTHNIWLSLGGFQVRQCANRARGN